jgi:hypothetical protein
MSSTRIYHNVSKLPIVSTTVLIFANYELWRIHKGTHPYWSPRLEAVGLVRTQQKEASGSNVGNTGMAETKAVKTEADNPSGAAIQWTNLNGVPIPTLEAFMRPYRKD